MKRVTFTKLTIQNFLSVGDEPVVVNFTKGLHIITGRNKDKPDRQNAVGKSTVADAFYFAIFGETLREIKKDLIINNITGGKAQVELEFEVNSSKGDNKFHVVRTLSPTKLSVYKDGVDKTRDSVANTTKYICDVLSATTSMFQNCVIMTVNNAVPFMAKNRVDKRKFIEDIFGLEVFSRMISNLRSEYNDIKREYDSQVASLEENTSTYKKYLEQQKKILDKKEERKNLYLERQTNNAEELQKLEKDLRKVSDVHNIDDIKKSIAELEGKNSDCDNKIQQLVEECTSKKTIITHKKEQHNKIGTSSDSCPVCLRSIQDHDAKVIEEEKNKLKNEITTLAQEVASLVKKIQALKDLKEKIKTSIQKKNNLIQEVTLNNERHKNIEERIKQLTKWQEELSNDILAVSVTTTEVDELIVDIENKISSLNDKITETSTLINKLDIVKFVISEEGVKSYIVNKLLELLNSRLYYYLKKLDSNSVCVFDEYFEEQIVNDRNKICSYFNFSGAERKSIDLACLFAFSDIRRMQGGVSYNIAIYDELFDSSFDEKSIDLITEILQNRVQELNECSIIISHRKESIKAVTGDVIYLEKENGITRRVDYN